MRDGRKGRGQGARGHHVAQSSAIVPAVEIAHLAGADVGGADRQPGLPPLIRSKSTSSLKVAAQLRRVVVAGGVRPEGRVRPEEGHRIGPEEGRDAPRDV